MDGNKENPHRDSEDFAKSFRRLRWLCFILSLDVLFLSINQWFLRSDIIRIVGLIGDINSQISGFANNLDGVLKIIKQILEIPNIA